MTNPHLGQPLRFSGAPLGSTNPVIVAVHGRNQDPGFVEDIVRNLRWSEATCVAPTAFEGSWYPNGFMSPIDDNQPELDHALDAYDRWVGDLRSRGITPDRFVLLGFSQGACLTAEYALRNPRRYHGIVVLTGGAIGPSCGEAAGAASFAGTPVFLGTSDEDDWVPVDRVLETGQLFRSMGASTVQRVYPGMGHIVSDEEVAEIRRMFGIDGDGDV